VSIWELTDPVTGEVLWTGMGNESAEEIFHQVVEFLQARE
jgi:hypothetical protein